jgi:alpha-N-arabinofuranosidase
MVAALSLDTFNRHADKVDMANVAQLVNNLHSLFLADGDRFVATPNFHVFTMYRPHQGARAVRMEVEAPPLEFRTGGRPQTIFRLAGSASRTGLRDVTLTLVHTHVTEPSEIAIHLRGGVAEQVSHTVLTGEHLNAHNTFDRPDALSPKTHSTELRGPELRCTLPAASINRLDIRLA